MRAGLAKAPGTCPASQWTPLGTKRWDPAQEVHRTLILAFPTLGRYCCTDVEGATKLRGGTLLALGVAVGDAWKHVKARKQPHTEHLQG
jgi:hypothetical protein